MNTDKEKKNLRMENKPNDVPGVKWLWCEGCLRWVEEENCTIMDVGIGPYEYWGAKGTDTHLIFTHNSCDHQVYTTPYLTEEYWPEQDEPDYDYEPEYDPEEDLPPK